MFSVDVSYRTEAKAIGRRVQEQELKERSGASQGKARKAQEQKVRKRTGQAPGGARKTTVVGEEQGVEDSRSLRRT